MLALKASSFLLMLVTSPVQNFMLPEQVNVVKSFLSLSCVNMDWISNVSETVTFHHQLSTLESAAVFRTAIHSILTCQGIIALAFRKKKVLYHSNVTCAKYLIHFPGEKRNRFCSISNEKLDCNYYYCQDL
jgi:hypothetical protein